MDARSGDDGAGRAPRTRRGARAVLAARTRLPDRHGRSVHLRAEDFRAGNPRFVGEAAAANQAIVDAVAVVAERHDATPAQVALAWVHGRAATLGVPVVPIPGTKRIKWLEDNVAAADLELTDQDLAELDPLSEQVSGSRY